MTFVKTALLLEKMQPGQKLAVYISAGEALENLPVAVQEKNGTVLSIEATPEGHHIIIIKKQYPP